MRVAFFVSSIGDTDLALNTIKSMEQKGQNETLLIALTKTAEQRISNFQSSSLVLKHTLSEILSVENFSVGLCTKDQLDIIIQYIKDKNINYAYFGVPSVSNEIPFQIAEALEDTPILMAYEFMFKPETHYLPKQYFSNNLAAFFSETRKTLREKADLGLNGKSAYENYADIIAG